jgi:hypothetical protein
MRWREALREHGIFAEWAGVVDGIRNGFDVGVKERPSRTIVHPNHASSKLDPSFIPSYIQSEIAAGRYSRRVLTV